MPDFYTGVGSRETPKQIVELMRLTARKLQEADYILRSGAADGADLAFESGVDCPDSKEIWIPWSGFNKSHSTNLPVPEAFDIARTVHPAWHKLTDGAKSLHARNIHQLLGADLNTPSDFVLCYTHNGDTIGGTATVIRLATKLKIPIFNFGNYMQETEQHLYAFLYRMRPDKL